MRLTGQLHNIVTLTLAVNITRAVKTHLSFQRSKPLLRVRVMGTPMFFKKKNKKTKTKKIELLLGLPRCFSDIQTEQGGGGGWVGGGGGRLGGGGHT